MATGTGSTQTDKTVTSTTKQPTASQIPKPATPQVFAIVSEPYCAHADRGYPCNCKICRGNKQVTKKVGEYFNTSQPFESLVTFILRFYLQEPYLLG